MYSSLSGSTFPPTSSLCHSHGPNRAHDSVQVSRARFYNPISRPRPGFKLKDQDSPGHQNYKKQKKKSEITSGFLLADHHIVPHM